ncbi:hypothetical protein BCV69DRAFT_154673 [Microstroma glucosiphilum]|uniref:DUF1690-domain-containing protein n=1 Tax=Pseudomicrostroma glucosiphilum TaxID=1684307 RepID=A0A316UBI1_9BASI|nr:hypothetical protein BCV69DRAFT_154673 [Pseudomicrostroma glucosiphilum]PWN21763.1 hypothetical protein BCV69DRAFT_154673 [Pseudomicrostroma glucosiphilum]
MGAQTSKPDAGASAGPAPAAKQPEEKISLSQSLLNKITSEAKITTDAGTSSSSSEKSPSSSSSSSSSSSPSDPLPSSRQSYLDSSVRSAISSELARLRKQEAEVTAQIQSKLEAENLAIEEKHSSKSQQSKSTESDSKSGAGRSSDSLRKELEEVKRKISRHDSGRKQVENAPGVKEARKSVIECYKEVGTSRTLDCWKEVKAFTDAVEKAERNYIASLSE